MKYFLYIICLMLVISSVFGYSFRLPVNFFDDPSTSAPCTVGVEPGATDGYDIGLDVLGIPPFMFFDAQVINDSTMYNFRKDIRSDSDTLHIWKIGFFNFTAPEIIARWTPSMVPFDSLRNCYICYGSAPDSTVTWVDMTLNDSLYIPVGYYAFVKFEQGIDPAPPDTIPPVISGWVPEDGDTTVSTTTTVSFMASDETAIDTTRLNTHLWVNGIDVIWFATITPFAGGMQVVYSPILPFSAGSTITAIAQVQDRESPPNITTDTISFRIGSAPAGSLHTLTVQVMLTGFPPPPTMSGTKVTITELTIWDTTDAAGMVVFDSIPADTYTVVATRDGYFTEGVTAPIYRDTLIMFILLEDTAGGGGLIIDGTVELEGATGLAGSIVELFNTLDSTYFTDTTDLLGYYNISGVMPGLHKLKASRDGFFSDSIFIFMFFSDTTVDFDLAAGSVSELLVIDWDNGDEPIPGGIGAAEALFDLFSAYSDSIEITEQDPNIALLNLTGVHAVALVTGNRLGVNAMIDDASLDALRAYIEGGGNFYWEGSDAGTDYSTGSVAAQNLFYLFGVDLAASGNTATTGNIEQLSLRTYYAQSETVDYAYHTDADHCIDEFICVAADTLAFSIGGPAPDVSNIRAASYLYSNWRKISSFYAAAIDSSESRDAYIYGLIYDLLDWTSVEEVSLPRESELLKIEPNPFNAACRIIATGPVEIYDLTGRLIAEFDQNLDKGGLDAVWDARDLSGRELPSGVYFAITKDISGKPIAGRRIFIVR